MQILSFVPSDIPFWRFATTYQARFLWSWIWSDFGRKVEVCLLQNSKQTWLFISIRGTREFICTVVTHVVSAESRGCRCESNYNRYDKRQSHWWLVF